MNQIKKKKSFFLPSLCPFYTSTGVKFFHNQMKQRHYWSDIDSLRHLPNFLCVARPQPATALPDVNLQTSKRIKAPGTHRCTP